MNKLFLIGTIIASLCLCCIGNVNAEAEPGFSFKYVWDSERYDGEISKYKRNVLHNPILVPNDQYGDRAKFKVKLVVTNAPENLTDFEVEFEYKNNQVEFDHRATLSANREIINRRNGIDRVDTRNLNNTVTASINGKLQADAKGKAEISLTFVSCTSNRGLGFRLDSGQNLELNFTSIKLGETTLYPSADDDEDPYEPGDNYFLLEVDLVEEYNSELRYANSPDNKQWIPIFYSGTKDGFSLETARRTRNLSTPGTVYVASAPVNPIIKNSVDPKGKLATTWGSIKAR